MLSAAAVGGAALLDLAVGEPPERVHPVALFGRAVAPLDRSWAHPRAVGALAAATLPLAAALLVAGAVALAAAWSPVAGAVLAALALFVSTSLRRLLAVARDVAAAVDDDAEAARERLRALAGRDASTLSPGQIRSAVVESVTENLADGLVAPLLAFVSLGAIAGRVAPASAGAAAWSLAAAAGGAAWVKAVNTMDSMLGYRSKPVGWAPARLDDAVMWAPARASAALLAAACLAPGSLFRAASDREAVPSPNSGWPMGTAAAALGVRLEKPGAYVLGVDASLPTAADVARAIRLTAVAGLLAYALAATALALAAPAGVSAWS